jgi:hypothetical protein
MATHLYDDLPTALAKAVARAFWRQIYDYPIMKEIGGGQFVFESATAGVADGIVEDAIRADPQGLGFLWNDDGSNAF